MKDNDLTIQNRLRDFRRRHELSQEDLADALGISRQSINALEQGRSMPSLPLAVSMCQFFNSAFEDIFEFEREMEEIINEHPIKIIINNPKASIEDDPSTSLNVNPSTSLRVKEATMPNGVEPWRPFREATSLRDAMDRLFEDSIVSPAEAGGIGMPKIDIKETATEIIVKAELPGVAEDDVEIEISDNMMTISGDKKAEKEEKEEGYCYKESQSGSFTRSFTLPAEVLAEKAEAEMDGGILKVTVPKAEAKKAKKIAVKKKAK